MNIDLAALSRWLQADAAPIKQIQSDKTLYRNGDYMFVADGEQNVLGFVKIVPEPILDRLYDSLQLIFVFPEYRGTNAKRLLLYAVKEETDHPVIADGAIFKDGQRLISKLLSDPFLHVQILDRRTGEVTPCHGLITMLTYVIS